jgi:hypothetical protein
VETRTWKPAAPPYMETSRPPAVETDATPGRGNRKTQVSTTTYRLPADTNHKI